MTNYIIDTHPLVWARNPKENKLLSKKVKAVFERVNSGADHIYIPIPVIWELGNLYRAGKLKLKNHSSFRLWLTEAILEHPNLSVIESRLEDVLLAGDLRINPDPFDNLIVATAIRMDLSLITKDEKITLSKACKVLW